MTILNSPIGNGRLLSYALMGVLIGALIMGGVGNLVTPPVPDAPLMEFPSSLQPQRLSPVEDALSHK